VPRVEVDVGEVAAAGRVHIAAIVAKIRAPNVAILPARHRGVPGKKVPGSERPPFGNGRWQIRPSATIGNVVAHRPRGKAHVGYPSRMNAELSQDNGQYCKRNYRLRVNKGIAAANYGWPVVEHWTVPHHRLTYSTLEWVGCTFPNCHSTTLRPASFLGSNADSRRR
jgi:hypothetical protein